MIAAINDVRVRLDRALIEGQPTAPIRAELAQLEQNGRIAAERDAASNAAEAARYRAGITVRGAELASETASRITGMIVALAPPPFPSTVPAGAAS